MQKAALQSAAFFVNAVEWRRYFLCLFFYAFSLRNGGEAIFSSVRRRWRADGSAVKAFL